MTLSLEAQVMQLREVVRQQEGANALLQARLRKAREAVEEASSALEHASYALVGDHRRAVMQAAFRLSEWLRRDTQH